jgi:holo-[acyl-carrier protein] synthase
MDTGMITGIGIDLIDIKRVRQSIRNSRGFIKRVFSPAEIEYCEKARGNLVFQRYAARFAAKEAFLKACGTGIARSIKLNEISVIHCEKGSPRIRLSGETLKYFNAKIGGTVHLSLPHLYDFAQAVAVIEKV